MSVDWPHVLTCVLDLVDRASEAVRAAYARGDARVDWKAPGDPVTDADRAANTLLCEGLAALFPTAAIVGEESATSARGDRTRADLSFFVDPIDGTRDFIERTGEFAVMVGVVHDARAVLGVVKEPATGRTFATAPGIHPFVMESGVKRPMSVSTVASPAGARLLVSRTRVVQRTLAVASKLGMAAHKTGSAGVKGARIAAGEADAFVHLGTAGCLWDAAAVDALVHAAGGRFTDERGNRLDYAKATFDIDRGVVASNGHLHGAILEAIDALGGADA